MRFHRTLALAALATVTLAAQGLKTEDDKTLYTLGTGIGGQLKVFSLTPAELEVVIKGLKDANQGRKLEVDPAVYGPKIQALATARRKAISDKQLAAGKAFQDKAAAEKGAVRTPSGLVYQSLREGTGATPGATDKVKVNYRGTLIDGTEFDSSYARNAPAELALNQVIKGWTEGLQRMKVGGKARLVVPAALAYGDNGQGPIPPGATLVFEVELLEIKKP